VRGELADMTYRNNRQRLRKYWMAMFGKRKIQDITHHDIVKAVGVLSQRGIGAISMTQYLQCLRSVFNYARAENLITHVPLFPKLRKATTSRGGFSVTEYRQLVRAAKELSERQDTKSVSHRSRAGGVYTKTESVPKEMAWLIVFMVNGFMRPSDVIHIQHQHVQVVRGEHLYLRLTLPETKRHKAQIVTLSPAVRVYERLLSYMQAQGMGKQEDYVFLPELKRRDVAGRMMAEHFNKILVVTGLRLGQLGQTRTLYSLRHTAIMFRLLYGRGIDLLTLARNARTSVQMIEKFYAANLTAEMNIDLIQGRRG
jgi:site-specific recombinase XerD